MTAPKVVFSSAIVCVVLVVDQLMVWMVDGVEVCRACRG